MADETMDKAAEASLSLAQLYRRAFELALSQNIQRKAAVYVSQFRHIVLGNETFQKYVLEGCTPSQLRGNFPSAEALEKALHGLGETITLSAIGMTVAQLTMQTGTLNQKNSFMYPDTVQRRHLNEMIEHLEYEEELEMATAQRLAKEVGNANAEADTQEATTGSARHQKALYIRRFDVLDREPLFTFIGDEILNGVLVSDPDWTEAKRKKNKRKIVGWRPILCGYLEEMREIFDRTACAVDWSVLLRESNVLEAAVRETGGQALADVLRHAYFQSPVRLRMGPLAVDCPLKSLQTAEEEQRLRQLGTVFSRLILNTTG